MFKLHVYFVVAFHFQRKVVFAIFFHSLYFRLSLANLRFTVLVQ